MVIEIQGIITMFNLFLNLENKKLNATTINVILKVKNDSDKNYLISKDIIMIDGFLAHKFEIIDDAGNILKYKGISAKYSPGYIFLERGQELYNELNLASAYDFKPGHYKISYNTQLMYCEYNDNTDCVVPEMQSLFTEQFSFDIFDLT